MVVLKDLIWLFPYISYLCQCVKKNCVFCLYLLKNKIIPKTFFCCCWCHIKVFSYVKAKSMYSSFYLKLQWHHPLPNVMELWGIHRIHMVAIFLWRHAQGGESSGEASNCQYSVCQLSVSVRMARCLKNVIPVPSVSFHEMGRWICQDPQKD